MNSFIDAAINRTRTTLLLMGMVIIAGLIARAAIPVANEPHIEVPFFAISIYHEGISPEDSERLLVMPMEVELRKVEGVKELTAYAAEGSATLLVEFDADYDLDTALLDVRESVDRGRVELPSTAEEPFIQEQTTEDFPIIQVNLVGDEVPERVLYNLAIDLRDDLEAVPGVLEAQLQGHREEQLEAIIDPNALEAYQVSNEELISTILRNNRLIPAGSIDTGVGRFSVKVPSVIEQAQDVFDLPIKTSGDTVVTLGDVAEVRRTFKDRISYARVNGRNTLSVRVSKRANANVIATIDDVKAVVERHKTQMPGKVEVFYSQDQAPFAEQQVTELQGNIFTALALVMVLVVAAMGFRSGLIVGLGIPVSFLFSLIFVYLLGYSFNFMVMFGMLLGLGMLIDGAIVVTEYADRKMTEGFDRRAAYAMAAKRMFWPVTASVATTLAAFLPLMFWPGIAGKFMRYLPVTVFTVLSGSLVYALIFGPVLGSLFGRAGSRDRAAMDTLKQLEDGDPTRLSNLTGWYAKLLALTSRYAVVTLTAIVFVLLSIFWAYSQYGQGMIFFSDPDPKFAQINIRARGNLSADEINTLVAEVEEEILEVEGIQGMNTYTTLAGSSNRGSLDRIGGIFLELRDENERERKGAEIFAEIRERTAPLAGISVEIQKMEQGPPVGKPIQIEFSSHTRALLEPAVTRVHEYLDTLPELIDLDDTRSLPGIEWKLTVDRAQAALYGADVSQVGVAVQLVTNGVKVGEYRPERADDAVDIRVRYPGKDRGVGALDDLKITTRNGLVPISNFVSREAAPNVDTQCGRRCAGGQRGRENRRLAGYPDLRPEAEHRVPRRQRGTGRIHGLRAGRVPHVSAADVRAAGHSVQQHLPESPDPDRGGDVHRRGAARPADPQGSLQRHPDRCRRGSPGGYRGEQQHRAHRHLQPHPPRAPGARLHRCYRAHRRAEAAPGDADHRDHHLRPAATGQQPFHRPDKPHRGLRRSTVRLLGTAFPGNRIRADLRHPLDPGRHSGHARASAPA
jgi:multidrug efflux pump